MMDQSHEFFVSGGALPLDSGSYIERSADRDLLNHLRAGRYCYVLNSRQMGKSSLCVRSIARLNDRGIQTAFINLTQIGQNVQADHAVELTKIRVSNHPLRSVAFTADGLKLLTAGHDETLRVWAGIDHDPTMKIPVPTKNLKNIGFE